MPGKENKANIDRFGQSIIHLLLKSQQLDKPFIAATAATL
jgi:hypothetical protein